MLEAHGISLLQGLILIARWRSSLPVFWGMTGVWLEFPVIEALTAGLGWLFYKTRKK